MLTIGIRFESLMAGTLYEAVPRELCHQSDDAEDLGQSRHPLLLRLPWTFTCKEPLHVRMLKLEGRPLEGENLSFAI